MNKKIKDVFKYKIAPLVPFSYLNKGIYQSWENKAGKQSDYLFGNGFISMVAGACLAARVIVFPLQAHKYETWDFTKWSEIKKERREKYIESVKTYPERLFKYIDQDKNGIIDSTEFVTDYKKRNYK